MASFWTVGSFFCQHLNGTKWSSPSNTSWQWTWNTLMAALAEMMKSEHETDKNLFSSLRLPTHSTKGWEERRYSKQMLFAPSHWDVLHLFSYCWWERNSCSLSLGGEKMVQKRQDKKFSEDQNSQWKGMKILKEKWEGKCYRNKWQTVGGIEFITAFYHWKCSVDGDEKPNHARYMVNGGWPLPHQLQCKADCWHWQELHQDFAKILGVQGQWSVLNTCWDLTENVRRNLAYALACRAASAFSLWIFVSSWLLPLPKMSKKRFSALLFVLRKSGQIWA